jgi:TolA-binding protein
VAAALVLVVGGATAAVLGPSAIAEPTPIDRTPVQAVLDRDIADAAGEVVPAPEPSRPRLRRPKLSAAPALVVEIEEESKTPSAVVLDADALYRRAEQHMARRDYVAARKDLRALLRRFPAYAQRGAATIDYARVEERLGRGQAAACLYARYLAEHATGSLASDARRALDRLARSPSIDAAKCRS